MRLSARKHLQSRRTRLPCDLGSGRCRASEIPPTHYHLLIQRAWVADVATAREAYMQVALCKHETRLRDCTAAARRLASRTVATAILVCHGSLRRTLHRAFSAATRRHNPSERSNYNGVGARHQLPRRARRCARAPATPTAQSQTTPTTLAPPTGSQPAPRQHRNAHVCPRRGAT